MKPAYHELRHYILQRWANFEWRHHGTGMLQAYSRDGSGNTDIRIHVWHPCLLLPGMSVSGAMHNHRFGFKSRVVVGSILHTNLQVAEDTGGAHQLFNIENASAGRDCDIVAGKRVQLSMGRDSLFGEGDSYDIKKWDFHWARPSHDVAVTFVDIHDKDITKSATLVAPYGTTPVHAFTHKRQPELEALVLTLAWERLRT